MKIAVGADHRGVALKAQLLQRLSLAGHAVSDMGTDGTESVDYPDFAGKVAQAVAERAVELGILICSSGVGMSIAANKFAGVRAAMCWNESIATLSRQHNNANVLCLAADHLSMEQNLSITDAWLAAEFQGGRHARRVEKIGRLGHCQAFDT